MTDYRMKPFRLFPNVTVQVFVQFILIFLLIVSVILFSSSSFYMSMIESTYMLQMRQAADVLQTLDFNNPDTLTKIAKIEIEKNMLIEIYEKSDASSDDFSHNIYSKYFYRNLNSVDETVKFKEHFKPIIDYHNSSFELQDSYDDGSFEGRSHNITTGEIYYLLVTPSEDGKYIFVTGVDHAVISAQAQSIAVSAIIIAAVIFIAVSIAVYFYITRITKPLNDINQVTKIMADGSNKSIRIPTRNNLFKTDTDDAIFNINMLYESLMLTQENLVEKSEFLAEQLEAKEIEQKSRAEFIADTSHELKTPISIIQGYAEGIKYVIDDKESAEEYCDTIIEECGRMTDLVVNMMSLSNIQHTDKLNWVDFSINEFIDERLRLHQKIFEKNSINAFNDIKDSIFGFADTTKLQFVINNLLSNAISYIGGESRQIKIRYDDMDLCYRIYVYNTGEPIPSDALQKLWDSFYRQDSARLRSDGHFGLGLSIVKAIQDVHSQQCGVENAENGVQFWFDIAKGKASEENKE